MASQPVIASAAALGEAFIDVTRGDRVESVHNIAACAVDRRGKLLLSVGEIDVPVYLRSSAKPFITAALLREGIVETFGFEPREIAIMAGSHNGEPFHIEVVRSILAKIGLTESALKCGAHPPYDPEAARALERAGVPFTAIHNNCSGKHAGILALCVATGADIETYLSVRNPAQRLILELCARLADHRVDTLPLGVDGCGIPVYAIPLRSAALSFARLASLEGVEPRDAQALAQVRFAMMSCPEYVGGTGEFDTVFMRAAKGDVTVKSGAEGVHGAAVINRETGLVLKVVDGNARAVAPAALHLLRRLDVLDDAVLREMEPFEHPVVYNRAGRAVGKISPR